MVRKQKKKYWFARLEAAIMGGKSLNAGDKKRAGSWTTCACGEQDPRIPRWSGVGDGDAPKDQLLNSLGMAFYNHITDKNPAKALVTLLAIEERAGEILAEVRKAEGRR